MNLISKLKWLISSALKGSAFSLDMLQFLQARFHNNGDKIIGWHKGCPSFSLLTPPMYSKSQRSLIGNLIASIYQWRKLPEIINIAVTDKCQCACEHCSFISMKQDKELLSAEELKKCIKQAQEMGIATINFTGGEALLRDDISELIKYVDKQFSQAILFTNGILLEEKARELRKAGLTSVIVSLDSHDPEKHDKIRNKKGLFTKAVEGIKKARDEKLLTGISTITTEEDIENGSLIKLIELGKKLKVNQIIVFTAVPTGRISCKKSLIGKQAFTEKINSICSRYNGYQKYPGVLSYSYLTSHRGFGCGGGTVHFYISPYGEVCPCDFTPVSVGNVTDTPLYMLWDRFGSIDEFSKTSLNGCKMKDPKFRKDFELQLKNKSIFIKKNEINVT